LSFWLRDSWVNELMNIDTSVCRSLLSSKPARVALSSFFDTSN